jgi:hypothetical protein
MQYRFRSVWGHEFSTVGTDDSGQNEPENSNPTYPTCLISAQVEAQIGLALRLLMDQNGFASTRLIGYEHNWDDAAGYPVTLVHFVHISLSLS